MAKKAKTPKRNAKGRFVKGASKASGSKRAASKSCGCSGTAKAGELSALKKRVTTVEKDLADVTEGFVNAGEALGSAVNALTRRVDAHDQAIAQIGARARGILGPGSAEPPRMPPRPPQAPPRPPQAPPRIAPGAGVPNRQSSFGFN
jgi:hypothetical protein